MRDVVRAEQSGEESMAFFQIDAKVRQWARTRDRTRPAFVFVNIMDAHDPYTVRDRNPVGARGYGAQRTRGRREATPDPQRAVSPRPVHPGRPAPRGLYLGDVAAADAKLGRILDALGTAHPDDPRIAIVTADHGEHLGEHRLSGHRFSVRTPALHVPLVVKGAPGLAPGVVDAPVEMRRVPASVLCWALGEECEGALGASDVSSDAPIISIWSDEASDIPAPTRDQLGIPRDFEHVDSSRAECDEDDPVHGVLVSWIRYPHKLNWAGDRVHDLFDLSWDPWERSDQLQRSPEITSRLSAELTEFVESNLRNRTAREASPLSDDAKRALRALGYAD